MKPSYLLAILYMIGFFGLIQAHEQIHVEIFKHYGIKSHVEWFSHFPDVVTVPEGDIINCENYCALMQNANELIGYYLLTFYGIFVLVSFYREQIKESKEDKDLGFEEGIYN